MFYKNIEDNILTAIGTLSRLDDSSIEITEEEYNKIINLIQNKPEDTETQVYKLHADTLEYIAEDRPEEPVPEEPNNTYGIPNDTYNEIYDSVVLEVLEENGLLEETAEE